MPATTIAQYTAQRHPDLAQRIANNLTRSSNIMSRLPVIGVNPAGVQWNELDALGAASAAPIGTFAPVAATARAAPTWTQKNRRWKPIYSQLDADAAYESDPAYLMEQIDLHTERVARFVDNDVINGNGPGDGAGTRLQGLDDTDVIKGSQKLNTTSTNGDPFDLAMLDELIVQNQHGTDAFIMHPTMLNSYAKAQRAAGGAGITETINIPNMFTGEMEMQTVEAYRGVQILFNNWIAETTKGTGQVRNIYAVKFDDGSKRKGLAGITPDAMPGVQVKDVGIAEGNLGHIYRVCLFMELVNFNDTSCSVYTNVTAL